MNLFDGQRPLPLELIEAVFDGLGDVVFCVKNTSSAYQAVNQAFVERLGYSDKADLLGRTASDFFPPGLAQAFEHQDRVVFQTGRPLQDQLERITHVDGSAGWFLASKYPIATASGDITGLIGISQDLNWPRDSDLEMANLRRLVDHIHQHLDQPLRTEQLACMFSLSAVQLDRRMKRVFRLSTKKFIMKCRLEQATRMLEATDDPISEIALACGFADQSALTRQFRSVTSNTPGNHRRNTRARQVGPGRPDRNLQ